MDGEEASAASSTATAATATATVTIASAATVNIASADSASLLPPHDSDVTPVGSPEEDTVPDIQAPPSDDDHDLDPDHDHDHDQGHGPSSEPAVLSDDLKRRIIKQVEYYFSDENLPTDKYLLGLIKKSKEGLVPITVIASFRKMKKLIRDYSLIVVALRESSLLVVSSDGKNVKRLHPFPFTKVKDPKLCTVLVENLPEDHSLENIRRKFSEAGNIKNICIREPHAGEETAKGSNAERLISSKLHALVEYKTVEAAEKAVATFNDEGDWRNGMRVKLLKQTGKYGQRRQAWRGPDSEKNVTGRTSDQSGDEKHNPSEHRDDIPDEEDAEHSSKEKNAQRGWNQGRSRKHKYRGNNGLGHGTTSSSHGTEASKPPPGPKMPDGTRGFAMGRGRPPVSNQS